MSQYGMFNPSTDAKGEEGQPKKPARREPGRGMMDGIRKDIKAAKESGEAYDPRGAGAAWTHNFLNKKPWHPLTFRNMARVYEKEQEHYETEKRKADSRAEFEAEQAYLKTLSLLSPEEQEKYRQRQSVSFLYMKPPGYDAALERAERAAAAGQAVGPGGEAQGQGQQQQAGAAPAPAPVQPGPGGAPPRALAQPQVGPGGHLKNVIGGIQAAQRQAQRALELKHAPGLGRSPPRGGGAPDAACQQFVVGEMDSEEEEEALRLAAMPPEQRRRLQRDAARQKRRAEKAAAAAQLDQAKAFLRAAGLALPSDDEGGGSDSSSGSSGSDSDSGSSDGGGGGRRSKRGKEGSGKRRRGKKERKERKQKKKRRKERRRD